MQAARDAVKSFTSSGGQARTDVDETVVPAVTQETIQPSRHEETQEAIDKEVHQHHYHTTVQPVSHKETLPEQHSSNILPTQERTFTHGDVEGDKARVASELGQFANTSQTLPTTQSTSQAAAVTGEHVHHHVHETVQPVIHKTTHQPEVIHTTQPIHETHIAPSEHHGLSTLPVRTLAEVQGMGADLTQGTHSHREEYTGHPKPYNKEFQEYQAPVDREPRKHDGTHDPEKTGHLEELSRPLSSGGSGYAGAAGRERLSGVGAGTSTTGGLTSGMSGTDVGTGTAGTHHHGAGVAGATAAGTGAALAAAGSHHGGHNTTTSTGGGMGGPDSTLGGVTSGTTGTTGTTGRDTYDEQASRGPATGTSAGTLGAGVAGVGAGAAAQQAGSYGTTGTNIGRPGHMRTTSRGYETSGTSEPSYGTTKHGYETHGPGGSRGMTSGTSTSHANPAAMGAGVAGVGAGAAAADLGRDHTRAGHNTGLDSTDVRGAVGDSGTSSSGTALGGLGGGDRSTEGASRELSSAETTGTQRRGNEPDNLEGGRAGRTDTSDVKDDVQHASKQGEDPNIVKEGSGKLTGSGVDGSHSAVFGLTPDGHRHDDTKHGQASSGKIPSREEKEGNKGETDTSSRAPDGAGVKDQLTDPKVAEKGHEGKAVHNNDDDTKIGGGIGTDPV